MRHPSNLQTTIRRVGDADATPLTVRVRDVARADANLVVGQPFGPGDLISIDLPSAPGMPTSVLACVVRAREVDGEWALGCTFSEELGDDMLASFGARRERPAAADQRGWVRFACNVQASYRLRDEEEAHVATVINVSVRGIGLLVEEPRDNGELLTLSLSNATGEAARTILACVVHVTRQADGRRLLGCHFIRELSDADLQALL